MDLFSITKDLLNRNKDLDLFNDNDINKVAYVYSIILSAVEELIKSDSYKSEDTIKRELGEYSKEQLLAVLSERNQFFELTQQQKAQIGFLYYQFIDKVLTISFKQDNMEVLLKEYILKHRKQLQRIIQKPVIAKPCFYYEPELQIRLLGIDITNLQEPIIDVGCGKNASLVMYLNDQGYECYGIDKYCESKSDRVSSIGWDEYRFEKDSWGTVISHMAFTNHFVFHYLQNDGIDYQYALKYMEIIESVKVEGNFYYCPGIPFIEKYLDRSKYSIEINQLRNVGITKVTRNK
jgi:hypothetical protein